MTSEMAAIPPSVSWAQRSAKVYLTFNVECAKPDIKIDKKIISFKGICEPDQKLHEVVIPLYAEIDPEKSMFVNKGRLIEVMLVKQDIDEPFWPTLTSDKKKHHWLKVDFNRWQDEDESGDDCVDLFGTKMGDFYDENIKDDTSSAEEEDLPDIA